MLHHSNTGECPEVSNKAKTRISVTVTKQYLDSLNCLVERGVYLGRGEIILEAIRNLLRQHGVEPFYLEVEEPVKPASKE